MAWISPQIQSNPIHWEHWFDRLCEEIAKAMKVYPIFEKLLRSVARHKHIKVIVVTCGLQRVWRRVVKHMMQDFPHQSQISVIGNGQIAESLIVSEALKADLVRRLREEHEKYTWVFGDSPLDLLMMKEANQAIVAVGDSLTRSKSMDGKLRQAIKDCGLRAHQILMTPHAVPRLDDNLLPTIDPSDKQLRDSILHRRTPLVLKDATEKAAARLLATPMRNSKVFGPALREAHRRVGVYLATEYVSGLLGVGEEVESLTDVHGYPAAQYALREEYQTTIVALMRGGDPMALGVSDTFPKAMYVHAKDPHDLKIDHLKGQSTVLLVDSVVNSGTTIVDFVKRIRYLEPMIRIVVVTGVAQNESPALITHQLGRPDFTMIALRLSKTKSTGTKGTDTGNRLFNTTRME